MKLEHPIAAALAVVSAVPFVWPIARLFLTSLIDNLAEAKKAPLIELLKMEWSLPGRNLADWVFVKLVVVVVLISAVVVMFYKTYCFIGGAIGLSL